MRENNDAATDLVVMIRLPRGVREYLKYMDTMIVNAIKRNTPTKSSDHTVNVQIELKIIFSS
jgi:hypothetical protein